MNDYTKEQIDKLQSSLEAIRKAGGWTAEEFGEMIGVTKQTIRNLENKTTTMTKTQYIAIRSVLDYEAKENPDNKLLNDIVQYLLDSENLSEEEKTKATSAIAYVTGAKSSGIDRKTMAVVVGSILGVAAGAFLTSKGLGKNTGSWLKKLFK